LVALVALIGGSSTMRCMHMAVLATYESRPVLPYKRVLEVLKIGYLAILCLAGICTKVGVSACFPARVLLHIQMQVQQGMKVNGLGVECIDCAFGRAFLVTKTNLVDGGAQVVSVRCGHHAVRERSVPVQQCCKIC
jgi:hypothetical protein